MVSGSDARGVPGPRLVVPIPPGSNNFPAMSWPLCALLLAFSAHGTAASHAEVVVTPGRVAIELRVRTRDLALSPVWRAGRLALRAYLETCIDLRAGGRRLSGRLQRLETTGAWTIASIVHDLPPDAEELSMATRLLLDVDPEHRQFVHVQAGSSAATLALLPGQTTLLPTGGSGVLATLTSFWRTGVEHILSGADHLAFVSLLLLLLPGRLGGMLAAVSAFTVAHCATLALAVTGALRLPGPWVETVIAFSVLYVAVEVFVGRPSLPSWAASFFFGLFHGLGFASALLELDWRGSGLAFSLLGFNLGVESGQVFLVGALWPLLDALRRRHLRVLRAGSIAAALVCSVAAVQWMAERWPA